jgi:hypothetical protein
VQEAQQPPPSVAQQPAPAVVNPAAVAASPSGADPSGQARQVEPGRVERAAANSGLIVGETKTTASTGDQTYKTEFVKVYQDAGVVGMAMLTLLVLCVLLGLFCSRLIKMYTALTESRDNLETARTVAIEKLTTSMVLLRGETNAVVQELRREHESALAKMVELASGQREQASALDRYAERAQRANDQLERVYEVTRTIPEAIEKDRARSERIEQMLQNRAVGDSR